MFITYGVLGMTSVLGYAMGSMIVRVGFLARGPVLGVEIVLLGLLFWRDFQGERKNPELIL